MVGTEEGNIYQANRYDRAGAKAGLNQYEVYKGHSGPVMGLHFHPLVGPVDFSDLFLTCAGLDWVASQASSTGNPTVVNMSLIVRVGSNPPPILRMGVSSLWITKGNWPLGEA
jgi:dynein intermediate chain